jgi:hypothetical protein
MIMDFFGSLSQIWYAQLLLWLTRRRRAEAGSCALAIRHHVTSARLRPRFRRGAGRCRFGVWQTQRGTQINTPAAALPGAATVASNGSVRERQKGSRPSMGGKRT